jgi:hypothetical protein
VATNRLNPKKSPGCNLNNIKILKELPIIGIKYLFSAILIKGGFPTRLKAVQIIFIPKPGKLSNEPTSYQSISLLPKTSKVFQMLLLKRILSLFESNRLTTNHQFGFRQRHSTIERTNRIVPKISTSLGDKQYCSAALLDI